MVFDAHDRAFALFKGTCRRGIYDNMKTAVETVFVGKDRLYNRRFLQMQPLSGRACRFRKLHPVDSRLRANQNMIDGCSQLPSFSSARCGTVSSRHDGLKPKT
jgi:hypothetical protein